MLIFDVFGQRLLMNAPLVVEGTIDYIEALFEFHDADWKDADKWAHFTKGDTNYIVRLNDDRIEKTAHLNLDDGYWKVFVHGSTASGQRITTEEVELHVKTTGTLDGEVLPEVPLSVAEQISVVATEAKRIAQTVRDDADNGLFDGESISVKDIFESNEDGGENVVTFSDGSSITIRNGRKGNDGEDGKDGEDGNDGNDGEDGVSPIVSVSDIVGGHRISITDANGSKYFDVMDGKNGEDGKDGNDGEDGANGIGGQDGVSPIVSVSEIEGGHRVTIIDANGEKSFDVLNGGGSSLPPAPVKFAYCKIPSDVDGVDNFYDMAYGNGRFVLIGKHDGEFVTMVTSDFVTYKRTVLAEQMGKIKFLEGAFFLIDQLSESGSSIMGTTIRKSIDGETWSDITMPVEACWTDIEYGGGYYVAIAGTTSGKSDISAYSTDLTNWTQIAMPEVDAWVALRFGTGWFIAITFTGTRQAVFSLSTLEWTGVGAFGEGAFYNIYFHDDKFYIPVCKNLGESTNEILVGNALEFSKKTLPVSAAWQTMAFGAGYGIVFAHSRDSIVKVKSACYTKDGGETWSEIAMPSTLTRVSADYGKGIFACVGGSNVEFCYLSDNY